MTAVVAALVVIAVVQAALLALLVGVRRGDAAATAPRADLERRLAAQQNVSRILVESGSATEATPRLARSVAADLGWDLVSIWQLAAGPGAEPVLPARDSWARAPPPDALQHQQRDQTFPPGLGIPGRVVAANDGLWVEDVTEDPEFRGVEAARAAGIHTAVAVPLIAGQDVLGALELMSTRRHAVDPAELAA